MTGGAGSWTVRSIVQGGWTKVLDCQRALLPRVVSNSHAPLLGEASVVFQLSQRPTRAEERGVVPAEGGLPWSVYAGIAFYGLVGLLLSILGLRWLLLRRRSTV